MKNIFKHTLGDFTFKDIEDFCTSQEPEGIALDYKREIPKDLADLVAAFSNTRGGMIIIGVVEDTKTGLPTTWEGVEENVKHEEKIHQMLSHVYPIAQYDVRRTQDAKHGKIFVLIRVSEGTEPPYYPKINDGRIRIRSGSIGVPYELASPEYQRLLFQKREKAQQLRELELENARYVFEHCVESAKSQMSNNLATNIEVALQPYFPVQDGPKRFISNDFIITNTVKVARNSFPSHTPELKSIPGGKVGFAPNKGSFLHYQVRDSGFVYACEAIQSGVSLLELSNVVTLIGGVLLFGSKLYKEIGYQGKLLCQITLRDTVKSCKVKPLINRSKINTLITAHGISTTFLGKYPFMIECTTLDLKDKELFNSLLLDLAKDLNWGFGYGSPSESEVKQGMEEEEILLG